MTDHAPTIPRLPPLLGQAMRPLPLLPLTVTLSALSRRLAKRHPGMFRRLGEHGNKRFALDPTDLPMVFLMDLRGGRVRLSAHRKPPAAEARIAGPIAAFLGMMHGAYDGDALFFSRDLVVEGDTSAVLALRNAIDDAELDLTEELADLAGPMAGFLRAAVAQAEKQSGVVLHRVDTLAGGWA